MSTQSTRSDDGDDRKDSDVAGVAAHQVAAQLALDPLHAQYAAREERLGRSAADAAAGAASSSSSAPKELTDSHTQDDSSGADAVSQLDEHFHSTLHISPETQPGEIVVNVVEDWSFDDDDDIASTADDSSSSSSAPVAPFSPTPVRGVAILEIVDASSSAAADALPPATPLKLGAPAQLLRSTSTQPVSSPLSPVAALLRQQSPVLRSPAHQGGSGQSSLLMRSQTIDLGRTESKVTKQFGASCWQMLKQRATQIGKLMRCPYRLPTTQGEHRSSSTALLLAARRVLVTRHGIARGDYWDYAVVFGSVRNKQPGVSYRVVGLSEPDSDEAQQLGLKAGASSDFVVLTLDRDVEESGAQYIPLQQDEKAAAAALQQALDDGVLFFLGFTDGFRLCLSYVSGRPVALPDALRCYPVEAMLGTVLNWNNFTTHGKIVSIRADDAGAQLVFCSTITPQDNPSYFVFRVDGEGTCTWQAWECHGDLTDTSAQTFNADAWVAAPDGLCSMQPILSSVDHLLLAHATNFGSSGGAYLDIHGNLLAVHIGRFSTTSTAHLCLFPWRETHCTALLARVVPEADPIPLEQYLHEDTVARLQYCTVRCTLPAVDGAPETVIDRTIAGVEVIENEDGADQYRLLFERIPGAAEPDPAAPVTVANSTECVLNAYGSNPSFGGLNLSQVQVLAPILPKPDAAIPARAQTPPPQSLCTITLAQLEDRNDDDADRLAYFPHDERDFVRQCIIGHGKAPKPSVSGRVTDSGALIHIRHVTYSKNSQKGHSYHYHQIGNTIHLHAKGPHSSNSKRDCSKYQFAPNHFTDTFKKLAGEKLNENKKAGHFIFHIKKD